MSEGTKLWKKAKQLIPGGNQLLSKRSEMFLPDFWPAYYEKAKGAEVWDLDGKRYWDMSIMGMGTCVLGYANETVNKAVKKAIEKGSMCTLNSYEEVELAEKLIDLHPWAGMTRFARTGGEACAIAVRIARAASGKDGVLFCGYHGWHDWYLSSNLADSRNLEGQLLPGLGAKGIPGALKGTALPFHYGNLEEFKQKLKVMSGKTGVVIMEVQRHNEMDVPFLKEVARLTCEVGAVLIYDEVTSGFRMRAGGLHVLHGLTPDIVVLGKAMGNGYPIAAVVGRKEVMRAAQDTFISSTYWTERIGFAAALSVIEQFKKKAVSEHLVEMGAFIKKGLKEIISRHGFHIKVVGIPPVPIMEIKEAEPLVIKTLITQEMLKRGYLASNLIYVSLAHTKRISLRYLKAIDEVLIVIGRAKRKKKLKSLLRGPICHGGFQRLA